MADPNTNQPIQSAAAGNAPPKKEGGDSCSEPDNIDCLVMRDIQSYMQERVQRKIRRYTCKARRSKRWYLLLSVTIAVGAALVPVLVNTRPEGKWVNPSIVASTLGILVSICFSCQEIFRFRDLWRNYDLISASLRHEEMLFSMSAEPYNKENREKEFVKKVEELIKSERWDTIHMRTASIDEKQNDDN